MLHVTGGSMDFRSKGLEHTVGCGFKIENFGLESATTPLNPQYGKEWSSIKLVVLGFFSFMPLFEKQISTRDFFPRRDTSMKKETARFSKKEAQKSKIQVPLISLDHSFEVLRVQGGCCGLKPKILNSEFTAQWVQGLLT